MHYLLQSYFFYDWSPSIHIICCFILICLLYILVNCLFLSRDIILEHCLYILESSLPFLLTFQYICLFIPLFVYFLVCPYFTAYTGIYRGIQMSSATHAEVAFIWVYLINHSYKCSVSVLLQLFLRRKLNTGSGMESVTVTKEVGETLG